MQVDDVRWCRLVQCAIAIAVENFGKQRNALDNCAAACTCVRWRAAAAESHISYLHLHADKPSHFTSWCSFFKARHAIARLKLTSDGRRRTKTSTRQLAKIPEPGCCLNHIPQGCCELSVSEGFLMQGGVISRLVRLQQLTLTWSASAWKISNKDSLCTYPSDAFPDLAVLNHLKHLELHQGTRHLHAVATFPKPSRPLPVLQHLVLERLRAAGKLLSSCSRALVTLELRSCAVLDLHGVQTAKLLRLNLEHSHVELHRSYITALTQLTFLGLAKSTWQVDGQPLTDPFKVFCGWKCLQVLQCNGCNLIDQNTEVHVCPATHLQVAYVGPGMGCSELSIVRSKTCDDLISISATIRSAACAACLVSLQMFTVIADTECLASLTSDLTFLLETCPRLQVLGLGDPSLSNSFSHSATLALAHNHGASLQKLHLCNLQFLDLDLVGAPCLSSIRLSHVDHGGSLCRLSLPSSLQRFTFEGNYLFTEQGRFALSESNVLTKLDLLPVLPGSWACTVRDAFITTFFTSLDHQMSCAAQLERICKHFVVDMFPGMQQP